MSATDPVIPPAANARDALRQLVAQKDTLEMQLDALSSQAATGQPLVDAEGFPRADLDVHTIRNARAELARLQTDHQALMKSIEKAMFAVHAEAKAAKLAANPNAITSAPIVRSNGGATTAALSGPALEAQLRADAARNEARAVAAAESVTATSSAAVVAPVQPRPVQLPFYRVAAVSQDSPAEVAGLRVGDLILQFGSVTKTNYSAASMANVVGSSIGRAIPVVVEREGTRKELRLIPQAWGGRGMLGCHLVDV